MHLFLTAFEDVPDPRAGNTRHVNFHAELSRHFHREVSHP